jgi:murein DD-endopeptidase MepM/ murein hydrolase activator NlpD
MRGHDVSVLQKFLTKLGLPTTRDAYYGTGTRHNVKLLEKRQGWDRDGKVSRKQAKQIKRLVATAPRHAGDGTRFYFYGPAAPAITVTADGPGTVRVDAVDSSGGVVTSLTAELGAAGTGGVGVGTTYSATVAWYGRRSDGTLAPDGTYGLSLGDGGGTGARITGGQTTAFELRGHIFPVRGAHDYGGAGSRFGAPRPGHIHQGQDVAAACGTPLLAAQGGTVLVRSYQAGGAGNYVVIRGKGTRKDYVYMHMVAPGPLVEGQPVRTGQSIGEVGNTGSSSGCHLHFERWTKPGWFAGGHAFDPLPSLQYWDSYS